MRRFSLLSFLALVLTVMVTVLGPAGVAAAAEPALSPAQAMPALVASAQAGPAKHEPCDPDVDNDCEKDEKDQDPCDADDHDCTPDDAKDDPKVDPKDHDQDPCDPDDKDCTPDDAKDKDDKGDAKKCDPDDDDCDNKDPGDEDGGGESALTEIVKNLIDRG